MSKQMTLAGFRVVDLGARASTTWCSRLLADYGADVQMMEPSDGHPLRTHPPFSSGESVAAMYFLANKRNITPDVLEETINRAHIVITDTLPGADYDHASASAVSSSAYTLRLMTFMTSGRSMVILTMSSNRS